MALNLINRGSTANDGTGDNLRAGAESEAAGVADGGDQSGGDRDQRVCGFSAGDGSGASGRMISPAPI